MVTCSDIEQWSAEGLQNVIGTMEGIHASHAKLGDTLQGVQANLQSWGGAAAEAWRANHGKFRTDVDDQGRQAKGVADALRPLYEEVLQIKAEYTELKSAIEGNGQVGDDGQMRHWKLNNDGTIDTGGATLSSQEAATKQDLAGQMQRLLTKAGGVDVDIANALNAITSGETPTTVQHLIGEPPLSPAQPDGITLEQLREIMPHLSEADAHRYLDDLNKAMAEGGINTPRRQAAFLAQVAVESGEFKWWEELGDEAYFRSFLGDDWQYHGRGPIQLTHSATYLRAGQELGVGDLLLKNPDLVSQPEWGFRTSIWFWNGGNPNKINLNELADAATPDNIDPFRQLTVYVRGNTGPNSHYPERIEFYKRAWKVLGAS